MNILTQYELRIAMQGAFLRKNVTCFAHRPNFWPARVIITARVIAVFRTIT